MKTRRTVRVALTLAFLVIACSSSRDEDEGCGNSTFTRHCTTLADCEGFNDRFTIFGGPDTACELITCAADGLCKKDVLKDTDIEDDVRGDCRRARCDEGGRLIHLVNRSDTGGKASSTCRRMKCEDGFGFGGPAPIETVEFDGTRCQLEGNREGVCESGVCVNAPPIIPQPPPPKSDAGDGDGGDGGDGVGADDAGLGGDAGADD